MSEYSVKMTAQSLVARLRHLSTRDDIHPELGICGHIGLGECKNDYLLMYEAFKAWPLFSGDKDYPVPHPDMPAAEAYDSVPDIWCQSTEYGANRWALVEHCIDYLESHYG